MSFATGMDAVQKEIEESKRRQAEAKGGGGSSSLNYLSWKSGDTKIVRFLTDDIITANFYDFIISNEGKTMPFMEDPTDPDRLKRYMSPTPGVGWRKRFNSDVIEEPKPTRRTFCMAVLRHEVPDPENPATTRIEDYLYEREVDGKTYTSRYFGLVQQGINNFWHTLVVSCFRRYNTITDRDYEITREGDGLDTKYSIIPLSVVPGLDNPEVVREFYFYGKQWDNNDPERFLKCPMTNQEYASYFSSEDRYKRLLVPKSGSGVTATSVTTTPTSSGLGEFHPSTTSNPDEAQAVVPPQGGVTFESLQDTLLNRAKGQS